MKNYESALRSAVRRQIRRRKRIASAWHDAQSMRSDFEARHPNASICARPLLRGGGTLIPQTNDTWWRYYTAIECGNETSRRICLSFKSMGSKAVLQTCDEWLATRDGSMIEIILRR